MARYLVYGGVIDSVASDATAYANRGAQLTFQLYASSPNFQPPYPSDGITFVDNMLASLTTSPAAACTFTFPRFVCLWPSDRLVLSLTR
jgi:hypothetical protein